MACGRKWGRRAQGPGSLRVPCLPLQEIAEPLFDLKVGMEQLVQNATFRCILATLLAVGNFLNGSQVSASARGLGARALEPTRPRLRWGPFRATALS